MPDTLRNEKSFKGKDLSGFKFTRLTVTGLNSIKHNPSGSRVYLWDCKCDCGGFTVARSGDLKSGKIKSCGCLRRETTISRSTKHGCASVGNYHPIYQAWLGMKARCENPNSTSYPWYGAKGIRVCKRWQHFPNFYSDMFLTWVRGLEIDRISSKGNYCPSNCRWSNHYVQTHNHSRNHWIEFRGERKVITEWSKSIGGAHSLVRHRMRLGWSIEEALTTPPQKFNRKTNVEKSHSL